MRREIARTLSVTFLVSGVCAAGTAITPVGAAYAGTGTSSVSFYAVRPAENSAAGRLCGSETHPRTARRLSSALRSALKERQGAESVAVYDRKRDLTCAVAPARRYDSASVIKVSLLAALLRKSMERGRWPSAKQRKLAHRMITKSDNDAASALWRSVGRSGMRRFLKLADMNRTSLGPGRYWGLSQITAGDQLRLLRVLTKHNRVLNDRSRRYVLSLMHRVVPSQRWGTPAGRPEGITWHVKNGWLPRHDRHWRVHSIGAFKGRGQNYMIVVLTRDTPSMAYGVRTIERVARAVHRTLNPDARSSIAERTPALNLETSDGSVPPGV